MDDRPIRASRLSWAFCRRDAVAASRCAVSSLCARLAAWDERWEIHREFLGFNKSSVYYCTMMSDMAYQIPIIYLHVKKFNTLRKSTNIHRLDRINKKKMFGLTSTWNWFDFNLDCTLDCQNSREQWQFR